MLRAPERERVRGQRRIGDDAATVPRRGIGEHGSVRNGPRQPNIGRQSGDVETLGLIGARVRRDRGGVVHEVIGRDAATAGVAAGPYPRGVHGRIAGDGIARGRRVGDAARPNRGTVRNGIAGYRIVVDVSIATVIGESAMYISITRNGTGRTDTWHRPSRLLVVLSLTLSPFA